MELARAAVALDGREPRIVVVVPVATTANAVAIAAASHHLVERPFLPLKDPRRREAPAAAPARSIAG
jgi:peptidoglycan/LPS O-acetylase OafA/YrhL